MCCRMALTTSLSSFVFSCPYLLYQLCSARASLFLPFGGIQDFRLPMQMRCRVVMLCAMLNLVQLAMLMAAWGSYRVSYPRQQALRACRFALPGLYHQQRQPGLRGMIRSVCSSSGAGAMRWVVLMSLLSKLLRGNIIMLSVVNVVSTSSLGCMRWCKVVAYSRGSSGGD